jgi:predicted dienelactone hydrolase
LSAALGTAACAFADTAAGEVRLGVPSPSDLRSATSETLHVIVWYPAEAGATLRPMVDGPPGSPFFAEGSSAPDAPLARSPAAFPLVVLSHGSGGDAAQMGWLGAALAARGFITAAVDHPGNTALDTTVVGSSLGWLRAGDLSRTIDAVLADPRFGPHVDRTRIGAAGFSFGGYAVLELAGARTDFAAQGGYCQSHPDAQSCTGAALGERGPAILAKRRVLAQSDPAFQTQLARASESYRDQRVKAVFAIAPALGQALTSSSLRAITIPVGLLIGAADPVAPLVESAGPIAAAIPGAKLTVLDPPVAHFTFVTQCAPAGMAQIAAVCRDTGPVRAAAHARAIDAVTTFFQSTLR